ncbi:hypothetical protein COCVIDRAFT_24498 [Bipolaris victoriae FI3]|uniref:Uncharacterized protein n=1 Tax=Bipolaris victoriae (strain FI3) TaxID=930091 RepID=W7ENA0_BIPV3|nr:hypothetical protein COCVIDRAFT_24498 [Bipolaris victoriae FI3]
MIPRASGKLVAAAPVEVGEAVSLLVVASSVVEVEVRDSLSDVDERDDELRVVAGLEMVEALEVVAEDEIVEFCETTVESVELSVGLGMELGMELSMELSTELSIELEMELETGVGIVKELADGVIVGALGNAGVPSALVGKTRPELPK